MSWYLDGLCYIKVRLQFQNDEGEGIKGDESDKGDNGVTTNGGSSLHFSLPTLTKRSVTLQMLLAAGILKPGDGTMSLEYHVSKFSH